MQRHHLTGLAVLAALLLILSLPGGAHALPGCAALGGTTTATECQITNAQLKSGAFEIENGLTLHFVNLGAPNIGSITTGGAALSIIVHGGLIMDAATLIDANKAGCGTGGKITLLVDGAISTKPGSIIRSNSCSGGEIVITSNGPANVEIDGLVESVGTISGVGAHQPPGGGPITVTSGCDLAISPQGRVSSRGQDPGADLVRLVGGCTVNIFGLVESTGVGHAVPNNPANHCDGAFRPGKPANSTACVEVVAGDKLVIDSKPGNNGEVKADTGGPGGSNGTSWIDLFALNSVLITGDSALPFSVHANGLAGTNDNGGTVTVKSKIVTASGFALQADAVNPGGDGGSIVVEATSAVTLDDAKIFARGDFNAGGGFGVGGQVSVRAFNGSVSWKDTVVPGTSVGDVRPTGSAVPAVQRGSISLTACTTVDATGTSFPVNGLVVAPFPVITTGVCGGAPTFPDYITFPLCGCQACIPA